MIRKLTLMMTLVGCVFFSSLLVISFVKPSFVERLSSEVIQYRLERAVKEKIESLNEHALVQQAHSLAGQYGFDIKTLQQELLESVPQKVASVMVEMKTLSDDARKKIEEDLNADSELSAVVLLTMLQKSSSFLQSLYMETAAQFLKDFRIFVGTNATAFFILFFVALVKRQVGVQFVSSLMLLVVTTMLIVYFYLFKKEWLDVLLFNSYSDWGYAVFIGVLIALPRLLYTPKAKTA